MSVAVPDRTFRAKAVVAGIGHSVYYRHGRSPDSEIRLTLTAILNACQDAGVSPGDVDGFASFSNDRNDPVRLAAALGIRELRFANMQWRGGGGGCAAAVANAAAAIATGMADCIVVHRGLAQGQFGRFGQSAPPDSVSGEAALEVPYGLLTFGQKGALRMQRFMHVHGVGQGAMRAVARASYHHAQANPDAVMFGRALTDAEYDASRWISEPFHLFDCCMESDGAAALVLVPADRARDLPNRPAYVLGAAGGAGFRATAGSFNDPNYAGSCMTEVAHRVYAMAGVAPADVGTVQAYENFTGGVVMAMAEHGLFAPEDADAFLQFDNLIAPGGWMPLNTSGGNLAECYMHGLGHAMEAVRQIRGTSTSQATRRDVSLFIGGPMVTPASSAIFGSENTL